MKALIIVDLQNDFCPGGSLPVPEGHAVVPVINKLQGQFDLVVATQDWHPKDHGSFASVHKKTPGEKMILNGVEQVLWPDHCVQGSLGAELVSDLDRRRIAKVFAKGTDKTVDSYSGFFDNGHQKSTGLHAYLKQRGASELTIVGLALDYCVKYTALDAVDLGYTTHLFLNGCRGVNLAPKDTQKAVDQMRRAGVLILAG